MRLGLDRFCWAYRGRIAGERTRVRNMSILAIEIFFLGLLALASLSIAWVSGMVLFKLYRGQR